ncbi:MAG: AAA family ATPase [Pirellulaceae bacterium]
MNNILNDARRVSTPLVAISTPDPAALTASLLLTLPPEVAVVQWDVINGVVARNELGIEAASKMVGDSDNTPNNPAGCAIKAQNLPSNTVLFLLQADRWLSNDQMGHKFAMACWNLRDKFKGDRRTLILLGHDMNSLPAELSGDTLQLDDPLPRKEEIRQIISDNVIDQFNRSITRYNNGATDDGDKRPLLDIDPAQLSQAVDANLGLTAYQVEQFTAMALRGGGIDIRCLEDRKEKQIERTPGLSVFRQASTFDDVGGCGPVKDEITSLMQSTKRHFQAVVWLDEIEKTGLGNTSDLSGVNSDAEGQILTYMEDHNPYAIVLVGVPGCGKSEIAKAAGATFNRPTIRFDLGGMKGSHVGESERYVREALRVTSAVTNDNGLWIATSNKVSNLSPALRSRFSDVFFFDLPSRDELEVIWRIWMRKFTLDNQPLPNDDGWVGRNIKKCCEKAYLKGITLLDAAKSIVAVAQSAADDIAQLRSQASGRFLSASFPGVYRKDRKPIRSSRRDVSVN